jgi:hypothetical protein
VNQLIAARNTSIVTKQFHSNQNENKFATQMKIASHASSMSSFIQTCVDRESGIKHHPDKNVNNQLQTKTIPMKIVSNKQMSRVYHSTQK